MKPILALSILFYALALPLHSETSETTLKTDIEVIKTEIKNLNGKIDARFEALDDRFKAIDDRFKVIDARFTAIDDKFDSLEKGFDSRFDSIEKNFESIEKNFDRQNNLIIACIGIPLAVIALMIAWRSVKDNSLQKQIDTLSQIIESQSQQLTEKTQ